MENINGVPAIAGWHDDPEDPNFIRYSNGRSWTGERVAKDRTLTLKNDNVYRPGGGIGSMPQEEVKEEPVVEEPVVYQPLSRRERRLLETPDNPELEPMSDLFEEEFEFQSAAPAARPYATTNIVPARDEPVIVEDEPQEAEVSFFDGFEEAFPKAKKAEPVVSEESDDSEASSLPSLNMGDFVAAPARTKPVEKEIEADDEVSSLPTLGGFDTSDSLPSLTPVDEDDDDEFFSVSGGTADSVTDEEPEPEEYNFVAVAPEPVERRSYEPPVVQRHSYELPVVKAPVPEAKTEAVPIAVKKASVPAAEKTADTSDFSEEDELETKSIDHDAQDDVPTSASFGFKSKLRVPLESKTVAEPLVAAAAPVVEPKPKAEATPLPEDDDDDSEDVDEQPTGLGGKFKSLFGRGNKDVLDYDYQNNDDDDDEPESPAVLAAPEPAAKPKSVVKSVKTEPVAEEEETVVDEEEPKLKVGMFSSRQDKEDAAVEVNLVDRLNDLAKRVAALKKDEKETLARLEKAKARETELNALILKAHEEHELLDQLAKGRRKEIEGQQTEKEDDNFLDFLEKHDSSAEEAEPEKTVALPVIKAKEDEPKDEEEETSDERLPELKFN